MRLRGSPVDITIVTLDMVMHESDQSVSITSTVYKQYWHIMFASQKGSTQKGKNLLPLGANSFLLDQTPFSEVRQKQY